MPCWAVAKGLTMIHKADQPRFTSVDHQTWRRFFSEIERSWERFGFLLHPYYAEHIGRLSPFRDQIPTLGQINKLLQPIGWTARYVDGYAPPWQIAHLLAQQVLPMSRSIRSYDEVLFGREPDIIHDIFGHLPVLFGPEYRQLLSCWSDAASHAHVKELDKAHYHLNKLIVRSHDKVPSEALAHLTTAAREIDRFVAVQPSAALMYDKSYFWIFEFGIVEHQGQRKVLGAGLLSSLNELAKLATGAATTRPLSLDTLLAPYNISAMQDEYLVVDGIDQYFGLLNAVTNTRLASPVVRELRQAANQ